MIDRRPKARWRRNGLRRFYGERSAKGYLGRGLGTEKAHACVAAAEMVNRRAAMLRAGSFVVVAVWSGVRKMSFGYQMVDALEDF